MFLLIMGVAAYVTYTLNLWGPILQMTNAASSQALVEFKKRLREFLENTETGRQAMAMSGTDEIQLQKLTSNGKARSVQDDEDDDEI